MTGAKMKMLRKQKNSINNNKALKSDCLNTQFKSEYT